MRISATQLEAFRLFTVEDWMTTEMLEASIRGEQPDSPQMALGRAFENILMEPARYAVPRGFVSDGYQFSDDTMARCLALVDRRGVFQVKATKRYRDDIDVVAKADQVVGVALAEWKTTTGSFDVEKYLPSLQWRFMVDIFQAKAVQYHVFVLDDHGNSVVDVRSIESFSVYPYRHLAQDCEAWVSQFADYVRARGLDAQLRLRQIEAA